METNASPEYNIAHHSPNANRRACHRDPRGADIRGQADTDLLQQSANQELCVKGTHPEEDRRAWDPPLAACSPP